LERIYYAELHDQADVEDNCKNHWTRQ
jgi:hypothetical protein